ncbi:MAG TPA: ATP-grasp domain-containing protein [Gammaproteobacteria bacterium]|nr:ATP-grasp domain-containing protein [Gammaproteobacteria bacterium]
MCLTRVTKEARPRLLLIAPPGSYRTVAYLESARELGVEVLVASEGRHSLVGEIAAGLHVDLHSPDALQVLLQANGERSFSGVVATDDASVELASRIARTLELPHNPPHAAKLSRRKDLSRQALRQAGVPVPAFRVVDLGMPLGEQLGDIEFPCVVKPLAMSASRGVIRADDTAAVQAACIRVQGLLREAAGKDPFADSHVLVEQFVPGPEVALEGLLQRGCLRVLAIFDKPDPLEGPYFEETYYITPSRHDLAVQRLLIDTVQAACTAHGLREGPVHAEARLPPDGCIIMEVAARTIGGECARLLDFGTGHSLEALVISHAVARPLRFETQPGGAGVLMLPITSAGILRRIEGITAARAVPWIEDILISRRDGYELVPLPEGNSYLGFMFARAPSAAKAEAALRTAHARLKVVTAPLLRIEDRR